MNIARALILEDTLFRFEGCLSHQFVGFNPIQLIDANIFLVKTKKDAMAHVH